MKNILPANLVKRALSGHSWIGLLIGGFMYLICLSGTMAVFFEEFERWEQPVADEYLSFDYKVVEQAFNRFIAKSGDSESEHMYIVFPSDAIPRIKFASDIDGWYVNTDGSQGERAYDDWSNLITGLHNNLHMPITIGIIFVSTIGALFCGLIITGFLSHPSIIKDAFKWRIGGSRRMEQVDLHNRLSVWGAPFHLMIAITGTFYGFFMIFISIYTQSIDGVTQQEVIDEFYTPEPVLENQTGYIYVQKALEKIDQLSPDGTMLFMIVHDANTENRFMEFFVQQPRRLIYSENYRFDMSGNYLGKAGYSDGETAKQLLYSVYRIHFGHFGGMTTKILFVILGLSLTIVSVSGINIWLEKRKCRDKINLLWAGFVWGAPLAFSIAAITQAMFHIASVVIFWGGLLLATLFGLILKDELLIKQKLQMATACTLLTLLVIFSFKHARYTLAPSAIMINLTVFLIATLFLCSVYWRYKKSLKH